MWAPFPRVASPLTPRLMLCLLGLSVLMPRAGAQTAQTLTWTSPTNEVLLLGQSYPLSAQSSSGLPVTFRVQNGPAVITGSTVTATNVGTVLLVAEQAGDAAHTPTGLARIYNQTEIKVTRLGAVPSPAGSETDSVQVEGHLAYVANGDTGLQIIDVSTPANPVPVGSYHATGGHIFDVQVVGHLAYVAANDGLLILDVGNPAAPVRLGGYPSGDFSVGLRVVGNIAYVADATAGLLILDVTDPAHPRRLGGLALPGLAGGVEIVGSLAYVADGFGGLQIINVSDPSHPVGVGSFDLGAQATRVRMVGRLAYVAANEGGLQILDVSNPAKPQRLGGYYFPGGFVRGVQVVGRYAYVAARSAGLQILDVIDPATPVPVWGYYVPLDAFALSILGQVAYVGDINTGLQLLGLRDGVPQTLDFSAPDRVPVTNGPVALQLTATASSGLPVQFTLLSGPAQLSDATLTLTNLGPVTVRAEQPGNSQFLPISAERTIEGALLEQALIPPLAVDVALTNPVVTLSAVASSGLPVTYSLYSGPATLEGNILTGTNEGYAILQVRQAGNSVYAPLTGGFFINFYKSGQTVTWLSPTDAVLAFGRAYPLAATASSGRPVTFRVESGPGVITNGSLMATNLGSILVAAEQGVDASAQRLFNAPPAPFVGGLTNTFGLGPVNALSVDGNRACMVSGSGAVRILSLTDPTAPVEIGNLGFFNTTVVRLAGRYLYLNDDQTLRIFDLSRPSFQQVGTLQDIYIADIQVAGNLVYLADAGGFSIYDASNPAQLVLVGTFRSTQPGLVTKRLAVTGHFAYLTDETDGLLIVDVADPQHPVLAGKFATTARPRGLQVADNLAYVTTDFGVLQIINVSDPVHPVLAGNYQTGGLDVQVSGSRAYLTQGSHEFQVVDVSNPATPMFMAGYDTAGQAQQSQVSGNYVYVAAGDGGLLIFDFGQPLTPEVRFTLPTPAEPAVSLTAELLGVGPADFQWFRDDQPLAGETNPYLHLPGVDSATAGYYVLEVTTASQQGRSEPLPVFLVPNIARQPSDLIAVRGLSNRLTVKADALIAPRYQWRHEGVPLAAQTNSALVLTALDLSELGGYDVLVSNSYGTVTSRVAQVTLATDVPSIFSSLTLVRPLPDGRILVAGKVNDPAAPMMVVRLLPDLSLDTAFLPLRFAGAASVADIASLPDGRIAVLGSFIRQNSNSGYLRCFDRDGHEDLSFVSLEGPAPSISLTPTRLIVDGSGNLLVSGIFATGGAELRPLVRVLPDGSRDPLFAANLAATLATAMPTANSIGKDVVQLDDGRLVLVGSFYNGAGSTNRGGIVRLNPDGTPDETFMTGSGFDLGPLAVTSDASGRLLVAGHFLRFNGRFTSRWIRLGPDGSLDSAFSPPDATGNPTQMEVLRGGQILIRTEDGTVQLVSDTGALLETFGHSDIPFAVEPAGTILLGAGNPARLDRLEPPSPVAPEIAVARTSLTVSEAASVVRVPVRRNGPADTAAQVTYRVRALTAVAGVDLVETGGTLQFAPGAGEATLAFPLTAQNTTANDDRTILVQLDSATGANLATGRTDCIVTLADDDVGLTAEIFAAQPTAESAANPVISAKPYFLRRLDQHRDDQVFFEWDSAGPRATTNDYFSVIWTGWIVPEVTGQYQLATLADDGVRVWLDDSLIVSNWTAVIYTTKKSGPIQLEAGKPRRLVVNYFEQFGQATCRLLWSLPGTTALTPIPRRVLRPGTPELTPPSLTASGFQITYAGEAGRPLSIQARTNATDWIFLREAVSALGGVTNSFTVKTRELTDGALLRAISIDGLAVTNALPPLIRVNGSTNGSDLTLRTDQTTNAILSVPAYEGVGQSIIWLRDGRRVGAGSQLVLNGQVPDVAGTYQAVVTYPFGQITSNLRKVTLAGPKPPRISTAIPPAGGPLQIHVAADPSQPGQSVRLETSTDLRHWETATTRTGTFDFTLPPATGPTQFIRAVVQ